MSHFHVVVPAGIYCCCRCDECTTRLLRDCICLDCCCDVVDHNDVGELYRDVVEPYVEAMSEVDQ